MSFLTSRQAHGNVQLETRVLLGVNRYKAPTSSKSFTEVSQSDSTVTRGLILEVDSSIPTDQQMNYEINF